MKLFFCASDVGGCAYFRSWLPACYFKEAGYTTAYGVGFPTTLNGKLDWDRLDCDVIVLQKHADKKFIEFFPELRARGMKILYDIDDHVWAIPKTNPGYYTATPELQRLTNWMITNSDAVMASTEPLAKVVRKLNPKTYVVPNLVDQFNSDKPVNSKLRVGWSGSSSHLGDFPKQVEKALRTVIKWYDVEVHWVGYEMIEGLPGAVVHGGKKDVAEYLDLMTEVNLDIGIAPLASNHFNDCKSNLKYLEYSSNLTASVLSNSHAYRGTVNQGEDGLVVRKDEWAEALDWLCSEEAARKYMAANAFNKVATEFSWQHASHKWFDVYKEILR